MILRSTCSNPVMFPTSNIVTILKSLLDLMRTVSHVRQMVVSIVAIIRTTGHHIHQMVVYHHIGYVMCGKTVQMDVTKMIVLSGHLIHVRQMVVSIVAMIRATGHHIHQMVVYHHIGYVMCGKTVETHVTKKDAIIPVLKNPKAMRAGKTTRSKLNFELVRIQFESRY